VNTLSAYLFPVIKVSFILCTAICFVCVVLYTFKAVKSGNFFDGRYSPPVYLVPPWLWGVLAVGLLWLPTVPYLFYLLVMVTALYLAVDEWMPVHHQFGERNVGQPRFTNWSFLLCGAIIFVEITLAYCTNRAPSSIQFALPDLANTGASNPYFHHAFFLLTLFQTLVLAPIFEEIFFRGFMFTSFKKYVPITVAAMLSAGVFALSHIGNGSFFSLWAAGIVLALAYQHTGSLPLVMFVHGLYNLAALFGLHPGNWIF
jgi:membrane protease YdiL (CAAX protease family)